MSRERVSFTITGGPKHWFDLLVCLGEPNPIPLYGYLAGGSRHPGFEVKTDDIWTRFPKPVRERKDKLDRIVCFVSTFASPPIRITGLSRNQEAGRYSFKGELNSGYDDPKFPVSGWFSIPKQKGELTVWEASKKK